MYEWNPKFYKVKYLQIYMRMSDRELMYDRVVNKRESNPTQYIFFYGDVYLLLSTFSRYFLFVFFSNFSSRLFPVLGTKSFGTIRDSDIYSQAFVCTVYECRPIYPNSSQPCLSTSTHTIACMW